MSESIVCQICDQICTDAQKDGRRDTTIFNCPTCGEYEISNPALRDMKNISREDKVKLSSYLRERHLRGEPTILLLGEMSPGALYDKPVTTIDEIIRERFPSLVGERLNRILQNIHRKSTYPGEKVRFATGRDYPVFFAENDQAMIFLAKTLQEKGWISCSLAMGAVDVTLTEAGWNRIAELEKGGARTESKQVFVAMWFDASLNNAWKHGFSKACEATGHKALRVDLKEHNDKICDAIVAEIRKSRFVVADFTGHRGGVYFEAGFALGLGIPVIWTCKKDELPKTHFDTRQYNHIDWENEEDLFIRLKNRIEATIPA